MNGVYFKEDVVNARITAIWSGCGEVLYFIQGENSGLLVDTNLGVGHLKELVDSMTDKPYEVVLTHGHIDHSLGAPEFERVYMNPLDISIFQSASPMEERIGYLRAGLGPDYEAFDFQNEDFVPPMAEKQFLPLCEGDCFDLGGLHVDVFSFPGHTPGSMILLIREERILILGDACNDSTFLFDENSSSVEAYKKELLRVKELLDGRFDRVFICHHAIDTGVDIMDNMVQLCNDIMSGNCDDIPFHFRGYNAYIAKKCSPTFQREDGKSGNLIYNKDKVLDTKISK